MRTLFSVCVLKSLVHVLYIIEIHCCYIELSSLSLISLRCFRRGRLWVDDPSVICFNLIGLVWVDLHVSSCLKWSFLSHRLNRNKIRKYDVGIILFIKFCED